LELTNALLFTSTAHDAASGSSGRIAALVLLMRF
jgi:hypothetical protein